MACLLGCIADDFTGATDLASTLARQGMDTVQLIGVPNKALDIDDAQSLVVALKSRTTPAADAVARSLEALRWLQGRGARQIFFKYCSTFDSTDEGNIGPVADALAAELGASFDIVCPAFPVNGRTVYNGHLFVGESLLSESGMRDHPLTPMRDANLVRVLGRQSSGTVGLVAHRIVRAGPSAIRDTCRRLAADGVRHAVVDAIDEEDLFAIGEAVAELPLVTGASGIAMGLPRNFSLTARSAPATVDAVSQGTAPAAVLAGSCSAATRQQVALACTRWPCFDIDPLAWADGDDEQARALAWIDARQGHTPLVLSSAATPGAVARVHEAIGRERAASIVEGAFSCLARALVSRGVGRLVVAGGETSGAVIGALGVDALRIGAEIDPGVPWCRTIGRVDMAVALKSGNFGAPDFFLKALGAT